MLSAGDTAVFSLNKAFVHSKVYHFANDTNIYMQVIP